MVDLSKTIDFDSAYALFLLTQNQIMYQAASD